MTGQPLIAMTGISVVYPGGVRALDDVTLEIARGSVVGLVGESGSGKTTCCRVLTNLVEPTSGTVMIDGAPLAEIVGRGDLGFRRRIQMLLQDAVASLSPRLAVSTLVEEPLRIHGEPLTEGRSRITELFRRLGLPADIGSKYPHQISGGQARRVAIARALVLRPEVIIADEPTAGLDVSVQGDLLNLLQELRKEFALTFLIVSHNLSVVRRITERTVVMYLGQIIEEAPTSQLFAAPAHPYTAALLSTNPSLDPRKRQARIVLKGEIPSVVNPPSGCRFHTRCAHVQERCRTDVPQLRPAGEGRQVRCHFPLAGIT